jgi:hypothetical protein
MAFAGSRHVRGRIAEFAVCWVFTKFVNLRAAIGR